MGIHLILESSPGGFGSPMSLLLRLVPSRQSAALVLLTVGIFLGYLKGKLALARSVSRQVNRILKRSAPLPITAVYSPGYYFLIAGMMGLGMSMRFLPIAQDLRGLIDLAVGAALIHGAKLYFRSAFTHSSKASA